MLRKHVAMNQETLFLFNVGFFFAINSPNYVVGAKLRIKDLQLVTKKTFNKL